MTNQLNTAVARSKYALAEYQDALKAGSIERQSRARAELRVSRQGILDGKAEGDAIAAIRGAMAKGVEIGKATSSAAPPHRGFTPKGLR